MSWLHILSDRICHTIPRENWLNFDTILAVSGGPDSVALVRLVHFLRENSPIQPSTSPLIVAHFNHGLRGEESDRDQEFVRDLTNQIGGQFRCGRSAPPARPSEEGLRLDRYRFLEKLGEETGARLIATGHTSDDQAETVLFRLFRGAGLRGLTGIRPTRPLGVATTLVRPLLQISRSEILELLRELKQPYRIDPSNAEVDYTRNYLRNSLIPELQTRFPGSIQGALLRLNQQAAETVEYLDQQSQPLFQAIIEQSEISLSLNTSLWQDVQPVLLRHFLHLLWQQQNWPLGEINFARWEQLSVSIITKESFSFNFPGNIQVQGNGSSVRFFRTGSLAGPSIRET